MITADKIFSEAQLKKLFNKLKNEKDKSLMLINQNSKLSMLNEVRVVMDFYMFSIISNTGLRISELLRIEISDVGDDFIKIRREISKSGRAGSVYFGKATRSLFDEYMKFRSLKFEGFNTTILFPSKHSKSRVLSRSNLHTRLKFWLNICGLPSHLSIHSLRHTYGTICLDKGLSLTFVRDQLRHSSISTTSKYLHLTKENRDKVKNIF
jgi:site-specific recombinase XerD